jgi:hypothetical protein
MQQKSVYTKFVTKERQHETTRMLPFTELRTALQALKNS